MKIDMRTYETTVYEEDIRLLDKISKHLAHKTKIPELGYYTSLSDEDVWMKIAIQFCVMGKAGMIDNLMNNNQKWREFKKRIGLDNLLSIEKLKISSYIDNILNEFKATRFHFKQAEKLNEILDKAEIIQGKNVVLIEGLSYQQHFNEIRDKLMERNPYFRLKSASDFMIDIGLSHDVIALDTRIVNILKKYLDLNADINEIQGKKEVYCSIEEALRQSCRKIDITLAQLDRMLFKFSGKNVISFILEDS